ncbi:hypothetical protein O3M35_007309 [Rhynocoris fuscipes]|uniref:Uncharacterized protein n=1 Tax=Rhynocoris fuscipes TaxID=488301 RepID=A0AAW1DAD7_9HEMI
MRRLYQNFKSIAPTVFLLVDQLKVANSESHYFKNGINQLKNFLYSLLICNCLACSVFGQGGCHFTLSIKHILRSNRSLLEVLSCNFIFRSCLPRLFRSINFKLIR